MIKQKRGADFSTSQPLSSEEEFQDEDTVYLQNQLITSYFPLTGIF